MHDLTDATRCPLCGKENRCALQEGASICWCMEADISAAALARVPEIARGVICICAQCARHLLAEVERKS